MRHSPGIVDRPDVRTTTDSSRSVMPSTVDPRRSSTDGSRSSHDHSSGISRCCPTWETRQAALTMGLVGPNDPVTHAVPKVGVVSSPIDYRTATGDLVPADEHGILQTVTLHRAVRRIATADLFVAPAVPALVG